MSCIRSMCEYYAVYDRRTARVARSLRRAQIVVNNWTPTQLEIWLDNAKERSFTKWYKYHCMVEAAIPNKESLPF